MRARHLHSPDISDVYFQVLIRTEDRGVSSFLRTFRTVFQNSYIDTIFRFYLFGHYGRVFYLRVWEKGIHKIVAGGEYIYIVPNKEFMKSVRFVREPPVIHHSISSLHGKKKTEGRFALLRPP